MKASPLDVSTGRPQDCIQSSAAGAESQYVFLQSLVVAFRTAGILSGLCLVSSAKRQHRGQSDACRLHMDQVDDEL